MEITEAQLSETENNLIRFFNHTALPRFMRDFRKMASEGRYGAMQTGNMDFVVEEFAEWLQYRGYKAPPYGTEGTSTPNAGRV